MSFGKSRAKRLSADSPKISFRDVAGVDEAVEVAARVRIPREPQEVPGASARGSPRVSCSTDLPGTGKTLLARARSPVSGRAGSFDLGSDFVRCCRRRRLPCGPIPSRPAEQPLLIFMDKIDAVGRRARRPSRRSRRSVSRRSTSCWSRWTASRPRTNHLIGGHQPARHPGPGAAAPGPLRPPDRRRPPDRKGRAKISTSTPRQAAREGHQHRCAGRQDPGLHRADLSNLDQRGGAARARTGKREITQDRLGGGHPRA